MVRYVSKADLLIRLGMQQDSWLDGIIVAARNPRVFSNGDGYYDASQGIKKLEIPSGKLDGRHGDVHLHGNPHYYLNPENGRFIALQIKNKLSQLDPKNKANYERNYTLFSTKLDTAIIRWKKIYRFC